MSDLDAFVKDERAVRVFLELEGVARTLAAHRFSINEAAHCRECAYLAWHALYADRERQLAEARQVVLRGDVLLAEVERRWDAAEAKLRAVGDLRSDVAGSAQILREMPDATEQDQRVLAVLDVFVDKLDAILGGDK